MKEIEAGRGRLRPPLLLAIDPSGGVPNLPGERCQEPTFGLPAIWIEEAQREEALARGCTVVDAAGVVATHLTELVRENMAELLSFAETQKLIDELPREHRKLVADLIPAQIGMGGIQRVLQALLAERVSIRDLPTILEGIQEACAAAARSVPAILAIVRAGWRGNSPTRRAGRRAMCRWSPCPPIGKSPSPRPWSARRRNASSPWRRRGCRSSWNGCARSSMRRRRWGNSRR